MNHLGRIRFDKVELENLNGKKYRWNVQALREEENHFGHRYESRVNDHGTFEADTENEAIIKLQYLWGIEDPDIIELTNRAKGGPANTAPPESSWE
jgi:hypothetical protein